VKDILRVRIDISEVIRVKMPFASPPPSALASQHFSYQL
jgi:hypothetical protein